MVTGVIALLFALAIVAVLAVFVANGGSLFGRRLTSHCKTFIASQPEPRLTYPGGTLISYRSNEGSKVFNEVDDPFSLAYIDVPASQSTVDAWYESWLQGHGWLLYGRDQYPQETWVRVKSKADDAPSVQLEYTSARGDQGLDATYPPDPSKHNITAVKLWYKVRLYSYLSTLCS